MDTRNLRLTRRRSRSVQAFLLASVLGAGWLALSYKVTNSEARKTDEAPQWVRQMGWTNRLLDDITGSYHDWLAQPSERRGLCPGRLEDLNGGAPVADAWGNPLTMTCSPVGTLFAVTSAGPDGFLGTGDDFHKKTSARPVARLLR